MLEELMQISELNGSIRVTRTERGENAIRLFLDVSAEGRLGTYSPWKVTCNGIREDRVSPGFAYELRLFKDHVLLWPFTVRRTSISFYGQSSNPYAVVGALYQRHWDLVGKWLPFHRFLNNSVRLTELIAGGFGVLADGPESLVLAYEEVMQQHGFKTLHSDPRMPVYWSGGKWQEEKTNLSVLTFNGSYIVAEQFQAEVSQP
jgi:hypothetical protein